ncbi:MAG: hypothetical protein LQ348_007356 [Seirophora lacunosa]|nr:MAG: hypothetical protein LQ348_007356 [Seirophora lacunosa]
MAPEVPKSRLQRLQARAKVPQKTTTIILASAVTIGVIILLFGGYSIYQVHMRQTRRRQQRARSYMDSKYNRPYTKSNQAAPAVASRTITPNRNTSSTAGQRKHSTMTYRDTWSDTVPRDRRISNSVRRPDPYSQNVGSTRWKCNNGWLEPTQRASKHRYRPGHPHPAYPPNAFFKERQAAPLSRRKQARAMPAQSKFASSIESSPTRSSLDDEGETPSRIEAGLPPLPPSTSELSIAASTAHRKEQEAMSDASEATSGASGLISSLDEENLHGDLHTQEDTTAAVQQRSLLIKIITMWNDEDNNPYGTFDRRGSLSPDPHPSNYQQSDNERPTTPTSGASSPTNDPPELISQPRDLSDDEEDNYAQQRSEHLPRKKGGYDSRIEQILYEHPELQIVITDAGKSNESGGSYIAYTIRTGDLEVRRRYSEFNSLRATLVNLHPTLIIPPIPEKHSMADYAAKPTKAKEDVGIIDLRKRMLTMFLNRCRKMREVREDGVWWRFLDPNASWSEVLHSHPVASIPKSIMRAPPLDPSNPTPAHQWLPVPSTSAKLRSVSRTSSTGTPVSPPHQSYMASTAAHTIPSSQFYGRFPPSSQNLSEQELDPYFNNFETNTRDLELLLQGSIEKVNRRTLTHLSALSTDMAELGARYNGFSLSEQSATVAAAIEKIGQAVDSSYIATEELSSSLGANFAEPMRESAQFAGVVRSVLRYRIMKRIQEEMTKDELYAKKNLLESLERSETEAKRIEQYLSGSTSPSATPKRSISSASARSTKSDTAPTTRREGSNEDADSVDSDFPPTHANKPASPPSSSHGPQGQEPSSPTRNHRKTQSGGFVANKIFGRISHAIHGVVDVDPERTRRDTIGKTRESLIHLEQALEVSEKDVKDASAGVLKDLKRFQLEKEDDLKRYMMAYAKCHIHWAKRNMETWKEAKEEVDKIDVR